MTSDSKTFGKSIYRLTVLSVGETKAFPCGSTAECNKIRKAAHNHNVRSGMYFTTRHKDGLLYVTRIR